MRGIGPRNPLPARRAVPVGGTLPQRLRYLAFSGIAEVSLVLEAVERIEELETAMRHIDKQECECSENHAYDPACPHTLALQTLSSWLDQ